MIDHLFSFETQAAARAALRDWTGTDALTQAVVWQAPPFCGVSECAVVTQDAAWNLTDPKNPVETKARAVMPDYWVNIQVPSSGDAGYDAKTHDALSAALVKLAGAKHATDRAKTFATFEDAKLWTALTAKEQTDLKRFEPVPAGSRYSF